jgi:hypothetical protein
LIARRASIVLALAALGCGAEFDPPHRVETLRVLGVQKSAPYAAPGEDVELRILWHDGSPSAPRPVTVTWFSGCINPPGDLYYNCFATFQGLEGAPSGSLPPGVSVGVGDRFTFPMPDDVISSRPPPQDPKLPRYGLAYVFFAACAGELGPAPSDAAEQFPLGCYDAAGKALDSDDFIVGYSAIYAYDEFRNENPPITGFSFNGVSVPPVCIGEDCIGAVPAPLDCSQPDVPCIFGCEDDGSEEDCDGYPVKPLIDPSIVEKDSVSAAAYGTDAQEQMWIRYFVDRGSVDSDIRLLNDASKGWNDDFGTSFRAPREPGIVNLWAVVYDNRGGVNWVRTQVLVQ